MSRRVLVTGVSRFLGLRAAQQFTLGEDASFVLGVDLYEPGVEIRGMEFVRADIRSPLIARVLETARIDTIVHTNITSEPSRFGGRSQMKENNVIGTMQLLAAAQRSKRVRSVVVKSSAAVYGSGPGEPSIIPEDHAARQVDLAGYAKDCADAETNVRDFGRRRPDVSLVILRTQNVIGPRVHTNITDYFSLPVIPTALGFDPRLQLLHEDDAVEALCRAAVADVRGIFNIAGDGAMYLSQAIRLLGKVPAPLALPAARLAAATLRRLEMVDFPLDQIPLIMYGRVLDTRRAREALGFEPRYSTRAALEEFRDKRQEDPPPRDGTRGSWERELFEYLKVRAKESV